MRFASFAGGLRAAKLDVMEGQRGADSFPSREAVKRERERDVAHIARHKAKQVIDLHDAAAKALGDERALALHPSPESGAPLAQALNRLPLPRRSSEEAPDPGPENRPKKRARRPDFRPGRGSRDPLRAFQGALDGRYGAPSASLATAPQPSTQGRSRGEAPAGTLVGPGVGIPRSDLRVERGRVASSWPGALRLTGRRRPRGSLRKVVSLSPSAPPSGHNATAYGASRRSSSDRSGGPAARHGAQNPALRRMRPCGRASRCARS